VTHVDNYWVGMYAGCETVRQLMGGHVNRLCPRLTTYGLYGGCAPNGLTTNIYAGYDACAWITTELSFLQVVKQVDN